MKLLESSVFKFSMIILFISGAATGFTDDLTWKDWLDAALVLIGIYATKEGVRYGSSAYSGASK